MLQVNSNKKIVTIWSLSAIVNIYQTKYLNFSIQDVNKKLHDMFAQTKQNDFANRNAKVEDLCNYGLKLIGEGKTRSQNASFEESTNILINI
jgi:hypothetical protein